MSEDKKLSLKEFRCLLYLTWSAGVAAVGRRLVLKWKRDWADAEAQQAASKRFAKERVRVQRICHELRQAPPKNRAVNFPYYADGALWLERPVRERILKLEETPARVFFSDKKKFSAHLRQGYLVLAVAQAPMRIDLFEEDRQLLAEYGCPAATAELVEFYVTAGTELTKIGIHEKEGQTPVAGQSYQAGDARRQPSAEAPRVLATSPTGVEAIERNALTPFEHYRTTLDFEALRNEPSCTDDVLVLQLVTTLEYLGKAPVRENLVRRMFEHFSSDAFAFREILLRLVRTRWLTRNTAYLQRMEEAFTPEELSERALLASPYRYAVIESVCDGFPNTSFLQDAIEWLLANVDTLADGDLVLLGAEAVGSMWRHKDFQKKIAESVIPRLGRGSPIFSEIICRLVQSDEVELAVAYLERHGDMIATAADVWAFVGAYAAWQGDCGLMARSIEAGGTRAMDAILDHLIVKAPSTIVDVFHVLARSERATLLDTFEEEVRRRMPTSDSGVNEALNEWFRRRRN